MPKAEWGLKKYCPSCEKKFYDLNRKPPVCPLCGAEVEETEAPTSTTLSKQVFTDNLDVPSDNNLVGSDPSESIAEVEDIEMEDAIDDDTISLDDSENEVQVITDEVDELDISENNSQDIDEQ